MRFMIMVRDTSFSLHFRWGNNRGQLAWVHSGANWPGQAVSYSPDGNWLATTQCADRTIGLRDQNTGKTWFGNYGWTEQQCPKGIAFSPDSKRIAISYPAGLRILDLSDCTDPSIPTTCKFQKVITKRNGLWTSPSGKQSTFSLVVYLLIQ